MGTNYYLHEKAACECCGRDFEAKHIGKSSGGWCFSLHVIPEEGINDLDDWKPRLMKPGAVIKDEYGRAVTVEEMLAVITERSAGPLANENFDYERNEARPGPQGLVRHQLNRYCVNHGAGTWDCVIGEFS